MAFRAKKPRSEFDQRMIYIARVARVVKGGRRFRFRATIALGDRKGKVGVGTAKGADVSDAMAKATNDAKRHMITVPLDGRTIPFNVMASHGSAKVLLKPAPEGVGIRAGGAVRAVAEMAGIEDLSSKILGSRNKLNNAKATIEALSQLTTLEDMAAKRGKTLKELGIIPRPPKPAVDSERRFTKRKPAMKRGDAKMNGRGQAVAKKPTVKKPVDKKPIGKKPAIPAKEAKPMTK